MLCREFALPGPSLQSAFICYHKLYTRLSTQSSVRSRAFHLLSGDPSDLPPYPFYLKAPCSAAGVLGFTIRSDDDLKRALRLAREEVPKMNAPLLPFYKSYLDLDAFPLAVEPILLVEEYVSGKQITIEGLVSGGEVSFTTITDTNNFPGSPRIESFTLPTRLSPNLVSLVEIQARKDVKSIGINDSFFNIEYWCTEDECILIEVNCRAATTFYNLYKQVLSYDVYRAGIELCLGTFPSIVVEPSGVGGQFNMSTLAEGNSSDLFDYAVHIPFFTDLLVKPGSEVRQLSEFGIVLVSSQ